MSELYEEKVFWGESFYSETLDFRGRINFCRFDNCLFVKCALLIDHTTEQLGFTNCTFKDCNIDRLESVETLGLTAHDNFFEKPIETRRLELEKRLAEALASRRSARSSQP